MKISKLESALILTEALVELGPHAHELDIYEAVYEFLEYAEEQEYDAEPLDEEDEYELTPAGVTDATWQNANPYVVQPYVDMAVEFSPFSPSVGTSEGTVTFQEFGIRDGVGGLQTYKNVMQKQDAASSYDQRIAQRAPVAERVHVPFKGVQKTIGEAFTPCGAD